MRPTRTLPIASRPRWRARLAAPAVALASLLALTACTAADDAPQDGDPQDGSTTGADGSTTAPDGGGDPAPTADEPAALGGADCLEGTWEVDPETSRQAVLAIPGFDDGMTEVEVTGTVTVTFDGSTMTSRYEEQSTVLSMEAEGAEFVTTTTVDGDVTGTYEATADTLTVADVETGDLSVTTTTTIDGEEVEVPELTDTPDYGFSLESVSGYECTDTQLRLTPQAEGAEGLVQVLTRRD